MNEKNNESFVGYEYKEINTTRDMESVYTDGYPSFGWKLDDIATTPLGFSSVSLKFKRDRKIRNKAELSRLQRQFDAGITEIDALERSKTTSALIVAMCVGLIGTAFLAGAVFALIYAELVWLMVVLAVPGFIGWGLPYMLYKKISAQKSSAAAALIDRQYDAMFEVCEKSHLLLNG